MASHESHHQPTRDQHHMFRSISKRALLMWIHAHVLLNRPIQSLNGLLKSLRSPGTQPIQTNLPSTVNSQAYRLCHCVSDA
eukprot:CAMPEP_0181402456 /NCGR_PEP_ID=MMETSP1110-20121109/3185_1 /TAXON_ID=174948 /ORGANISM="Symbiodinium sp., Strain CCMP421" /LENGTH=80 /DNA_ID=CAMNT_0023524677 /DNA_START=651 /DNA_END=893 /DNA_ORIENTATION=+